MTKFSNRIKFHPLTFLLFAIGFLTGYIKYLLLIFLLVVIHETGHIFFARIFKRKIVSLEILPFGGLTKMDAKISENIYEDLLIDVGGIFFQTVFGYVLLILKNRLDVFEFLETYNMLIIGFNLIPVCPLDGYKIVKNIGEVFFPFKWAKSIACFISLIFLVGISLTHFSTIKDNVFVFIFLIFMLLEEIKNGKYVMNRFYLERLNYDFHYPLKNVKKKENMYKNRINYINHVHEKEVLKDMFTIK